MRTASISRSALILLLGALLAPVAGAQQAPAGAKPASLSGFAYDSVRGRPMDGAQILVQGTALVARAGADGSFHLDSVPPGAHKLQAVAPILDSLGIQLVTPPIVFTAGKTTTFNVSTPSSGSLVRMLCPAAWLTRGPAALFGRVRNADTDQPVARARVSVVWYEIDFTKLSKVPRLREAVTQPDGTYRICGLPGTFDGKVQVDHAGLRSGDVPVVFQKSVLEVRSLSVASVAPAAVAVAGDTNPPVRRAVAMSRLVGRVLGTSGAPVAGARVQLEGTLHSVNTSPDGSFVLDSLPSGSQVVRAMYIGFTPVEQAVELSARDTTQVTLQMQTQVATLPTVVTQAQQQSGLDAVGFTQRQKSGFGYFLDTKTIDRMQPTRFTDALAAIPGIHVTQSGYDVSITDNRDPMGGCVKFVVDGSPWESLTPGDVNSFIQGQDLGAIEVYHGSETPPQFQFPGQTGCSVIVAW
ncbi:MAG: carboxypeptidase regulatory-like domain-containing protein, partial [Gemmatimonadota bacterium]|nr:carboxypeptidase regulatory-like domain-containing protein [Gemmatimonadota bacterium]